LSAFIFVFAKAQSGAWKTVTRITSNWSSATTDDMQKHFLYFPFLLWLITSTFTFGRIGFIGLQLLLTVRLVTYDVENRVFIPSYIDKNQYTVKRFGCT